jgi:hypothetical protein
MWVTNMSVPDSKDSPDDTQYIRIKREPMYVWLGRLVWLIGMAVLLEYALQSRQEREPQAAITAGALCLFLLIAGVIVEVVRHVESQPTMHLLNDINPNQDEDIADE